MGRSRACRENSNQPCHYSCAVRKRSGFPRREEATHGRAAIPAQIVCPPERRTWPRQTLSCGIQIPYHGDEDFVHLLELLAQPLELVRPKLRITAISTLARVNAGVE